MSTVITVENLGKKYTLHHQQREQYTNLRDVLTIGAKNLAQRIISPFTGHYSAVTVSQEDFWALKDVSFEVKQGDRIGIIGRNGAGKSTLLKILSRITEPTTGSVRIKGRVASLLEVGTGFHPELTGRENIFLNGAILGMSRAEIKKKFDEIVGFAEIERFLDTPVKRYSSGMYVRLAFAVAAHLEPEILIVDEVLAVGDAKFQKKCLGKMEDVGREGRTVIFVSHNMGAIQSLCSRALLVDKGMIVSDASTEGSMKHYSRIISETKIDSLTGINNETVRRGGGAVRFLSVEMQDLDGNKRNNFAMGETIRIAISYQVFKPIDGLMIYIALRSSFTREIITSVKHVVTTDQLVSGIYGEMEVELPEIIIRPGEYPLYLLLCDLDLTHKSMDLLDDLVAPLMITVGENVPFANYDPTRPIGCFSLPSNLVKFTSSL